MNNLSITALKRYLPLLYTIIFVILLSSCSTPKIHHKIDKSITYDKINTSYLYIRDVVLHNAGLSINNDDIRDAIRRAMERRFSAMSVKLMKENTHYSNSSRKHYLLDLNISNYSVNYFNSIKKENVMVYNNHYETRVYPTHITRSKMDVEVNLFDAFSHKALWNAKTTITNDKIFREDNYIVEHNNCDSGSILASAACSFVSDVVDATLTGSINKSSYPAATNSAEMIEIAFLRFINTLPRY